MPLINGAPILHLIRGFRVCHIGGRFGSGKSLLAYRLAYELLRHHGYRYLLSNCRDAWSDRPEDIVLRPNDAGEPTYLDAVVVLDEAGVVFNTASEAKAIISFARKMNVIFIFPSFEEPPARVRFLQVQRLYNLQVLGLPLWWYGARLNTRMARDRYAFGLWRPSEMYGIYDTGDFPADAAGIDAFLREYVTRKTGGKGRYSANRPKRRAARTVSSVGGEWGDAADAFAGAADEIQDALSVLADVQPARRSRRR